MYYVIVLIAKIYLKIFHNYKVIGKENIPEGPCVMCPNHYDSLDPFIVAGSYKSMLYFLAKKEIKNNIILGAISKALGCIIFVDRGKPDIAAIKASLKALKAGEKLVIFPEGHRYKKFDVANGKAGATTIAMRAKCPIAPISIKREWKGIIRTITCTIHKPIYAEDKDDKEFLTVVMEKIGEGL